MPCIGTGSRSLSIAAMLCVAILAEAAAPNVSARSAGSAETATEKEWLTYSCEEYGFSIEYPPGYEVIVAEPRSETESIWSAEVLILSELHKVTFLETEYEMWPGQFEISVMPNEDGLELEEWVERYKESGGPFAAPDQEDPSIFGVGEVTIDGNPVVRLHLFNYDHTGIVLFTLHGGMIYKLDFAGENPNDPNVAEHKAIYEKMIESLELIR